MCLITSSSRGKKIFRRFDGDEPDEAHSPTADPTGTPTNLTTTQDDQQRSPTRRRFTRSSIQPRLLWPADEQHHQEHLQHEAEEAPTDIEEEEQHHLNNTTAHTVPDLRDDHAIGHRPVADNVNADNPKTAYPTAEGAQQTSAVVSPANERTIDTLNEADVVRSVFDAAPEAGASASFPGSRAVLLRGNDRCSPFDKWRRSKAGASQPRDASAAAAKRAPKRESDDVLASGTRERGKRTKGGSFGATEAT